ncbi:biliverdin-producing heme oxygenase [uncultured Alsobacter sp.]|uniref:biliverdin-producing heme oxygenase n=1 Tax=uncultured Alsobacter sp. TaxID=1748258 RepID=UPI0025E165EC|nr:biliverdin-producing heme oxygenase [uncultured Alsobacter sp.]
MATAHLHRDLDTLIGDFVDPLGYGRYVLIIEAFRSSVEACFQSPERPTATPAPLSILDDVRADCRDLGLAARSSPQPLALGAEADEWLGAQYVLEGSMLGARVLFERAQAFGFTQDFGARHLAVQSRSIARWQSFLGCLEGPERFNLEAAAAGAERVFRVALEAAESIDVH